MASAALTRKESPIGPASPAGCRRRISAACLRDCDLLVLPSHIEALPMVVLEAMSHQRAVLATSVGSVADAVEDGVTGLLVPPREVPALTGALERLIRDPALRREFGAAGRRRYERDFTISVMNAALADLFAEVITARRD